MKRRSLAYSDLTAYFLVLFFCFTELAVSAFNIVSYLRYILPLLGLIFFSIHLFYFKALTYNKGLSGFLRKQLLLLIFIISISVIYTLVNFNISYRGLAESIFISSPLILAALIITLSEKVIQSIPKLLLYLYIICFFISSYEGFLDVFALKDLTQAFITSTMPTESTYCFLFGMLSMYFFVVKKRRLMLIALLFTFLGFKRIVFLTLFILSVSYLLFPKNVAHYKWRLIFLILLVNTILIIMTFFFLQGYFDEYIADLFDISANAFSMGRMSLLSNLVAEYGLPNFFGIGLGGIYNSNVLMNENGNVLLHSDILKLLYELGIFAFIIWLISFYSINFINKKTLFLALYLNILFFTDNILIYFHVMFPFYLLQANLILRSYYNSSKSS